MKILVSLLILAFSFPAFAEEEVNPFLDLEYYLQKISYQQCDEFRSNEQVKIAILENSFPEFTEKDLETLPEDYELLLPHNNPTVAEAKGKGPNINALHGKYVAQLIYLITTRGGRCPELAPKLYLIPAGSYNKLEQAINVAIEKKVDFILHTNVNPYYGFGDGFGFLNTLVNRAIDAGITWVNAAGNFKEKIYQDKIVPTEDGSLYFATEEKYIRLFCPKTPNNETCPTTIVLQWDDFSNTTTTVTDKHLSFELYDHYSITLDDKDSIEADITSTRFPHISVTLNLLPGKYKLRIKDLSKNFGPQDQFRLIVNSEYTVLESINNKTNYLLPPADNSRVVTVGASDSEISSVFKEDFSKRHYMLASSLRDTSKPLAKDTAGEFLGSSISSTMFVSLAAMVKARFSDISEDEVLKRVEERFIKNSTKCHYTINVLHPDKEFLRSIIGVETDSVTFYPHEDGVRYLLNQDPHNYFGLPRAGDAYFYGISPTGEPGIVRKAAYLSFIHMDGVVVDKVSDYSICKQ